MNILFVINGLYTKGNGLCSSARRTIRKLKEAGHDVRTISMANPDKDGPQPEYILKRLYIPIFNHIIVQQGYDFAKTNKKLVKEAVAWADVVHIEEPFFLEMYAIKTAKKMHKPLTGTYHLHPENISASFYLDQAKLLNKFIMWFWKLTLNKVSILQCPTKNVKDRLIKCHYKPELRVISNGLLLDDLTNREKSKTSEKISDAKYVVTTIGRYSGEKDLKRLLRAMNHSKHSQEIQLVLAGQGPKKRNLEKFAKKLVRKGVVKYPPIFGFFSLKELQNISLQSDLYVHCAFVEVEGLSCMEAIQTGIVPIIAKGKYSATSQFALSEMSTFNKKDAKELGAKIDYWLDHEEERKNEAKKYLGLGEKWNIDYSIKELEKMFEDAIEKNKEKNLSK